MSVEILICHQSDDFYEEVFNLMGHIDDLKLIKIKSIDEILDPEDEEMNPQLAIQEAIDGNEGTSEWAQTLKMSFPHVPVMVLYSPQDEIKTQLLIKNGASYALQRPFDDEFIMDAILELIKIEFSKNIPVGALEAIRVRDLILDTEIEFDLFTHLPANKKTLRLRGSGSTVDQDLIDKAIRGKGQQLYVLKSQLPAFFSYVTKNLRKKGVKDTISMTEKASKLKKQVQKFVGILLDADAKDFDQGKDILALAEEIIEDLGVLDLADDKVELYEKIIQLTERPRTNYNTMINVSVYATIFAKILGFSEDDLHDIAMAGVMHNIGLSKLSIETARKLPSEMSDDELIDYHAYPSKSLIMVKAKRVPLEEDLCKVIEQHMENTDGTGFPKKLRSQIIKPLAKVLRIAKDFNALTSLVTGEHEIVTPTRAFKILLERNDPGKGDTKVDYAFLRKIATFFEKTSVKAEENLKKEA